MKTSERIEPTLTARLYVGVYDTVQSYPNRNHAWYNVVVQLLTSHTVSFTIKYSRACLFSFELEFNKSKNSVGHRLYECQKKTIWFEALQAEHRFLQIHKIKAYTHVEYFQYIFKRHYSKFMGQKVTPACECWSPISSESISYVG